MSISRVTARFTGLLLTTLLAPVAVAAEPAPIDIDMPLRQVSDAPIKTVIVTHYHADHIYGLQVFQDMGARIIAPGGFQEYLDSPVAEQRLEERRFSLDPWVNDDTRLVRPDVVIVEDSHVELGGVTLEQEMLGE